MTVVFPIKIVFFKRKENESNSKASLSQNSNKIRSEFGVCPVNRRAALEQALARGDRARGLVFSVSRSQLVWTGGHERLFESLLSAPLSW